MAGLSRTIIVADSDADCRALISGALGTLGYRIHEAETGEQALVAARQGPALVILDALLPGASGYEVCGQLREELGDSLPVVFVSGERTASADLVAGFLVGADDYLVKPFDPYELLARVRRLLTRTQPLAWAVPAELTPRELQVFSLLAEGHEQHEIAKELVISSKTVAKHIEHILAKLDVHSRAQAVALALREPQIPTPA